MNKGRLEAFSDGVIAIIITIMVLDLKVPHGASLDALLPVIPVFLSYVLSYVYVGIYWNNHHHMLHTIDQVGAACWAPRLSQGIYLLVAALWLVPDRRIENALAARRAKVRQDV